MMSLDGVDMVSSIAMPLDEVVFLVVDPLSLDGVILALASCWAFSLDGVILALASCWAFSLDGVILASGKQTRLGAFGTNFWLGLFLEWGGFASRW